MAPRSCSWQEQKRRQVWIAVLFHAQGRPSRSCLGLCHSVACGSDPEAGNTVLGGESGPGFVSIQTPTLSPELLILREGSKRLNLGPLISKMEVVSQIWGRGLFHSMSKVLACNRHSILGPVAMGLVLSASG